MSDIVTIALAVVEKELRSAIERFGPMASPHEGKAVIEEEFDELWDEIKANRGIETSAFEEAVQLAAMATRYLVDLCPEHLDWSRP